MTIAAAMAPAAMRDGAGRAASAACCSASFLDRPSPEPSDCPPTVTDARKDFWWSGPLSSTWYSGTPEPDRFKDNDAGNVLHVTITAPGEEPVVLPVTSQALYMVQRLRDEAHRFAIGYHRKVRAQRSFGSAMDNIPGIGPRRKKELLRRFGSVAGIRNASAEELAATRGMTLKLAEKVKEHL